MRRRANHEGTTARLRKDGRWQVDITDPETHRRYSLFGTSAAEVNEKRARWVVEHVYNGVAVRDGRVTVASYLADWLASKTELRASTVVGYRTVIDRHIVPEIGDVRLEKLTPLHVKKMLDVAAGRRDRRPAKKPAGVPPEGRHKPRPWAPVSPRTEQLIRAVLRAALHQAVMWEEVARNVADLVPSPKVQREPVKPLDVAQVTAFLEGVAGDRLEALYVVAFTMGLRQGELLGLRWTDVDLDGGELHVVQQRIRGAVATDPGGMFGEPKSRQSRRTLPIPEMTAAALRRRRAAQGRERLLTGAEWHDFGLVFTTTYGKPLDGTNVRKYFKRHLVALGLPDARFHDMRHTAASLLLAQGVELKLISEILGHSQISLTADTYTHVLPTLKRQAATAMDAIFAKSV